MPFMNLFLSLRGSSEVVDRKTNDKKSSCLEGERVGEECLSQESKDLAATTVYIVLSLIWYDVIWYDGTFRRHVCLQ